MFAFHWARHCVGGLSHTEDQARVGIPGELVSPAFDTTGAGVGVGVTAAHRGRLVPLAPPVGLGLKLNCVDVR